MAGKVIVAGIKKIDKVFRELGSDALKVARKVMRAEQKEIKKKVQSTMPVGETKQAKKGVYVMSGKRSRVKISINTVIFDKSKTNFHTQFLEYGTKDQPAQGTIRKVWDENKDKMKDSIIINTWKDVLKLAKAKGK